MKKILAVLAALILLAGCACAAEPGEDLPQEIRFMLAGTEITHTAYWDYPGATWFIVARTYGGANMLICYTMINGAWARTFDTTGALPQEAGGVEQIHVTDRMRDFKLDREFDGPILIILGSDGSYTSYQRNEEGEWNLLRVFFQEEQTFVSYEDESVTFRICAPDGTEEYVSVPGFFERDLEMVELSHIPVTPEQAREVLNGSAAPAGEPEEP